MTTEAIICGAGIAGISAAYHLSVRHGIRNVLLVDERPPMSLTSDKSTECYRNWWPGPGNAMVSFMNRSIDIMEELARASENRFHMNRRGYLFVTADPARIPVFLRAAEESASLGAGPVRCHTGKPGESRYMPAPAEGFENQPVGADLITDTALIREHFPYLSAHTAGVIHARRCGFFSAQQLGMYLLECAREQGVRLMEGRVDEIALSGNRLQAVRVATPNGSTTVSTRHFVNAAGPFLPHVARLFGVELPVYHELHVKVAFQDHLQVIRRNAPLLIWADPTFLPWTGEERSLLAESEETQYLLEEFPSGVHARTEGGAGSNVVLILWTYDIKTVDPVFPFIVDPYYPEITLRGLAVMVPGLEAYLGCLSKPVLDGGYYTKTTENRPLIGPLPVEGTYVIGALSGFGLMAASAAGELLAAHLTGSTLPDYAPAFSPDRYQDPAYKQLLASWDKGGQL